MGISEALFIENVRHPSYTTNTACLRQQCSGIRARLVTAGIWTPIQRDVPMHRSQIQSKEKRIRVGNYAHLEILAARLTAFSALDEPPARLIPSVNDVRLSFSARISSSCSIRALASADVFEEEVDDIMCCLLRPPPTPTLYNYCGVITELQ